MSYKYKNTSDQDLSITGVGFVEAGKTIEVAEVVNNPNLELVSETTKSKSQERREAAMAEATATPDKENEKEQE